MGASDICTTFDGSLTQEQLRARFAKMQEDAAYENGHSYSGSWNMLNGLSIRETVFDSVRKAETYILDNTEKWQHALAVRARRTIRKNTKLPTFNGRPPTTFEEQEPVGQDVLTDKQWSHVPADQLSEEDQKRYMVLWTAKEDARRKFQGVRESFSRMSRQLVDSIGRAAEGEKPTLPLNFSDVEELYWNCLTAAEDLGKRKAELDAFCDEKRKELYSYEQHDNGEVWVLGGWAAS